MAVKLPPNTWIGQVLTFKGFKDNVYSKIDGSLVGYVKDGKFIQTINQLPVAKPEKKAVQDKAYAARIKEIAALNSIPPMEQDAEYYRSIAENINKTPAQRKEALTKYNKLKAEIAAAQKAAGVASTTASTIDKQKLKAKTDADNKKRATEIEKEYTKYKEQFKLVIDPKSASAENLKNKMEKLVTEYKGVYSEISGSPISTILARSKLNKTNAPTFGDNPNVKVSSGPSAITGVTGPTGPTGPKVTSTGPTGSKITATGPTGSKVTVTGPTGSKVTVTGPTGPTGTKASSSLDTLLQKTEFWYDLPDYIFKLEPALGKLLVEAVDGNWPPEKFLSAAQLTPWWQKNAPTIRTRIVDQAKYNELRAAGQDVSKTEYGLYLGKQMNAVKAKALAIAGVTLTDEQAQSVATKIYNGFLDDDPVAISALIVPFIGKVTSIVGTGTGMKSVTAFSGQALQSYQTLQAIAKANGFTIKDILPNISTSLTGGDLETAVLQKLALGEIDINRVAQDARALAAQGQPQYVRNLLNQGYDLENVYAPYKQQMAAVLEVQPDEINLNDPTLRSAITDKGDMNMYDFKRSLRQDNRWQYTQSAKTEVSDTALRVLKDFGFQG
jgi:hypothetical protein